MATALWFEIFVKKSNNALFSIGSGLFIAKFQQTNITVKSADPRVNRLPKTGQAGQVKALAPMDQFGTWEVFVKPKEGKPFQHEGIVHAPNAEMAFILAKETFTRRFTCTSLCVVDTRHVFVSPFTEGEANAYHLVGETGTPQGPEEPYEIYHLLKRGKQHVHAGTVMAADADAALVRAKHELGGTPVRNVWAIRKSAIRFTSPVEADLWQTLPDKKFREAIAYKGGDKLKEFLERRQP